MKSTTISLKGLSALTLLTSCTLVDTPEPTTYTTTTGVAPTVYGSTETTTTRTY